MAKPAVTAPIASVTSLEQLQDLIGATNLVLPADALAHLDAAGEPVAA
jgi:aryl-alcohol dehydrogenase-like predicted oxidoreductase